MLLSCLDVYGCCELASTFNVLTWRVMPDFRKVPWKGVLLESRSCPSQSPYGVEFTTFVVVLLLEDCCYYELFHC